MFRTGSSGWLAIALVAATCLLTARVGWALLLCGLHRRHRSVMDLKENNL
jgi:hypothetical protein